MSNVPDDVNLQELTVVARRVLLDGLNALKGHLEAITVVGAQAVYLRTPSASMRSAPFTADGDLSVDPLLLPDEPLIEQALRDAGFELLHRDQPGLWARTEKVGDKIVPVELDLLVPANLTKRGKRSARIPPHGPLCARWVPGLEVAAVDRSPMTISSLDPDDPRTVTVNVAGPAALLVAKAFKIDDRREQAAKSPDRLTNKDAGDVLRLMMTVDARDVAASFAVLREDPRVGATATEGAERLYRLFGGASAPGVELAVAALRGDVLEARVRALAPAFVKRLRVDVL
ncbi:hypothetical protein [Actinoallomurus rhizosphaericola]|uniref:hypothetical protein n=1 Tax=Actinoallomurus rhizosphaericola TaxID=2952536 RepID=UPI00209281FC|nr:hypothetical protein [Actinoallomurus rhizosphaericola]MCO5994957.1 hypothetical protein [Actinoallomurus rhizosphaericola]